MTFYGALGHIASFVFVYIMTYFRATLLYPLIGLGLGSRLIVSSGLSALGCWEQG